MLIKSFAIFACMLQESPRLLFFCFVLFFFSFPFPSAAYFFTAAYILPQRPFRCARAAFIRKEKESPSFALRDTAAVAPMCFS